MAFREAKRRQSGTGTELALMYSFVLCMGIIMYRRVEILEELLLFLLPLELPAVCRTDQYSAWLERIGNHTCGRPLLLGSTLAPQFCDLDGFQPVLFFFIVSFQIKLFEFVQNVFDSGGSSWVISSQGWAS